MSVISVEKAKDTLRDEGYFVDNLWSVDDVIGRHDCNEDEAQEILSEALQSEFVVETIRGSIDLQAAEKGLQKVVTSQYKRQ
jgi:hypothetical protein